MKLLICFFMLVTPMKLLGVKLISDQTIKDQIAATEQFSLKNGAKVIYRKVKNSDIIVTSIDFMIGTKDIEKNPFSLGVAMSLMTEGSKKFPKKKLFAETSKYSIGLSCSSGLEQSSCGVVTLNEYFDKASTILEDVIYHPALKQKDFEGAVKVAIASTKSSISDSEGYANTVVNRVFYPEGHPYKSSPEDSLKELETLKLTSVKKSHKRLLSSNVKITVIGSLETSRIKKILNSKFGERKIIATATKSVFPPEFSKDRTTAFEHREVPTAYIKIKFNGPPIQSPEIPTITLLTRILNEELDEQVRTKRSLSYHVYSYNISNSIGIWVMGASTSSPKETLEVIANVVDSMKTRNYSKQELDEFKTRFVTKYYLSQQSHSALAKVISKQFSYFNSANKFYYFPKELDKVTSNDIKKAAQKYLKNFRIGVVYDKNKYDQKWSESFVDRFKS